MKPLFYGYGGAQIFFGVLVLIIGIVGIALPAAFLGSEYPVASAYLAKLASVGEDIGAFPSAITGALAGGAVSAVGGVICIIGGIVSKSRAQHGRAVFALGLCIGLIGGLVMIIMGATLSADPVRQNLGPDTYTYNADRPAGNTKPGTLPANQENHKIFSLAVYERCCYDRGWISQGLYGPCGVTCPSAASGNLLDPRINLILSLIDPTDLCTCVKDPAAYTAMLAKIDNSTCDMLNKVRIFFYDSLTIPTTKITIGSIKSQLFPNTVVIKVPVVGFQLAPELDLTGQTQTGYGFGCGLGYEKGLMWVQEIYYDQNITPLGSQFSGVGGGVIGIVVFTLLVFLFLAMSDDSSDGNWDQTMAGKWQNDNVATGVLATPQMQMQQQAPPYTAPPPLAHAASGGGGGNNNGMMMAQNPTYRGQQQPTNPNPGVGIVGASGGDLSAQLRAFYRQYDPKKTEADVATISAWARQNGIQALNNKLRAKYNADLSGPNKGGPPI